MPRSLAGVRNIPRSPSTYSLPPGTTPQQPNTVISSSMFNAFADDVAQTFNTIQPIVYGGTGSNDLKLNDANFGVRNNADATKIGVFSAANIPTATTRTYTLPATSGTLALTSSIDSLAFGNGLLSLSGGNLSLGRVNGKLLPINGVNETIPSTSPTLAATGLTPSTLYYIYAYMNSGVMTLEASTTAYAVDATTGVNIKTGDATRTLVGMARPVTGPAWVNTAKQRFVRSWFNDPGVKLFNNFTANRTTTSATFVELSAEIRCEALLWAGESFEATGTGSNFNNTADGRATTALGFDGTSPEGAGGLNAISIANQFISFSVQALKEGLSEGYHFVTLLGAVDLGTGAWTGNSPVRSGIIGRVHK